MWPLPLGISVSKGYKNDRGKRKLPQSCNTGGLDQEKNLPWKSLQALDQAGLEGSGITTPEGT